MDNFRGLYNALSQTHNDSINDLKDAIDQEDYDYGDIKEMVRDKNGDDLDAFLEDYDLHTNVGLKEAIINHIKPFIDDTGNIKDDVKDDIKDDIKDEGFLIKKLIEYDKNVDNGVSQIKNNTELQEFLKKIECNELFDDEDKAYNYWIRKGINNGNRDESILLMMADNFTRFAINKYKKHKKINDSIQIRHWIQEKFELYTLKVNPQTKARLFTAFNSFFKRVNQKFTLPTTVLIKDDINLFAKIIMEIFDFIKAVIASRNNSFPCQVCTILYYIILYILCLFVIYYSQCILTYKYLA